MPIDKRLGQPHTPGCNCDNPQCVRDRDNEREMLEVVGGVMPIDREETSKIINELSRKTNTCVDLFYRLLDELDAKDAEIQKLKSAKVSVTVVSEFDPHRRIFGEIIEIENDVILVEGEWND